MISARALALLPLLAACSVSMPDMPSLPGLPGGSGSGGGSAPTAEAAPRPAPLPVPVTSVRHVAGFESYPGGELHLFIFQPEAARPLDDRIAAARASIAADPACRWLGASRGEIETLTANQGADYSDTLLVAPLDCT